MTICPFRFKCTYVKHEKLFLIFFLHFLNLHTFIYFGKKYDRHRYFISEIKDCEKRKLAMTIIFFIKMLKLESAKVSLRLLSKKCRFRTLFDSQHVRRSQTLAKGAMRVRLSYVFIALREPTLECISLSYMSILIGVS